VAMDCSNTCMLMMFGVVALLSLALTPAVRAVARRFDIFDYPDQKRKLHGRRVPLWGGVAVYLAMLLGLLMARALLGPGNEELEKLATALIPAAGLACWTTAAICPLGSNSRCSSSP
jgi:UDP-N-acetylmuramyl pentapeptide phosphotransferase/UDP-N-acetylglucosamine-1-phosphate transferase